MFARWRAMLRLMMGIGRAGMTFRTVNILTRFEVLDALRAAGFFEHVRQPIATAPLIQAMEVENNAYTRDVLSVLAAPLDGVLVFEDSTYRLRQDALLPTWDALQQDVPEAVLALHPLLQRLAGQIVLRMAGEPITFTGELQEKRESLLTFDTTLNNRMYDTIREAVHIWAGRYLRALPAGAALLDVGCGSGRETAHLYTLTGGAYRITACDPVPSFIDMAQERFTYLLRDFNGGQEVNVPPERMPEFHVMPVEQLDFPDQSFDAVFHSAMLHWTSNGEKALDEMFRVLKPGGVLYGMFNYRPQTSAYLDLLIRANGEVNGFPLREDAIAWHRKHGAEVEMLTSGIYRARYGGA